MPTTFQEKQETDPAGSVSLLTPHCPSDHMKAVVQRPQFTPSVSSLLSLLRPFHQISRSGRSDSLFQLEAPKRRNPMHRRDPRVRVVGNSLGSRRQNPDEWHHNRGSASRQQYEPAKVGRREPGSSQCTRHLAGRLSSKIGSPYRLCRLLFRPGSDRGYSRPCFVRDRHWLSCQLNVRFRGLCWF